MATLEVTREQVVKVFEAVGFRMASKWEPEKMQEKLEMINEIVDPDVQVEDEVIEAALLSIIQAAEAGDTITVVESAPKTAEESKPEAGKKDKKDKKGKKDKKDKKDKKGKKDKDDDAKPVAGPKKDEPKKIGIVASILEFLWEASKEEPITKKRITAKLAERFPDRSVESMAKTVAVQVPTRVRKENGWDVRKNDEEEYWVSK